MSKRGKRKKKASGPTIAELRAIESESLEQSEAISDACFEASVAEHESLWAVQEYHPELRNNEVRLMVPIANRNLSVNERERIQARACCYGTVI